ncbi:MAG: histidinol dehydrogenase [Clostridia bacterium]|nr:histidinol dehydrogenase [Clostridia bacterium]
MIKIYKRNEITTEQILERSEQTIDVEGIVSDIIKNVRANGDKALVEYSKKFDGAVDDVLEVTQAEIDEAFAQVDEELISILKEAKENITAFHSRQVRNSFLLNEKDGVIIGQKVMPIEKVGLYVPGGTAAYPSSVLMNCVPAKIAG